MAVEINGQDKQVPAAVQAERDKAMASLVLHGDLSKLDARQKLQVYVTRCETIGLNWRALPYDYLKMSGKETLYLSVRGIAQLNLKHKISHEIKERTTFEDAGSIIHHVEARAVDADGRYEDASAEVVISGSPVDRCNLRMKCETKAKARATKMLVGEGGIDENEVDMIPGAQKVEGPMPTDEDTVEGEVVAEPVKGNGKTAKKGTTGDITKEEWEAKKQAKAAKTADAGTVTQKPALPPVKVAEPDTAQSAEDAEILGDDEDAYAGDENRNLLRQFAQAQGYGIGEENKMEIGDIMKEQWGITKANIETTFTNRIYKEAVMWFTDNPKPQSEAAEI